MSHDQPLIYLDHNATTPVAPEVLDAMLPYLRDQYGNPSSDHPHGRRAAAAVDQARARVADLIGADPADIVFTSGGTESNNLAIRGTAAATDSGRRRIITTVLEHPATTAPCQRPGTPLKPLLLGAGQEHRLRPGTENVASIVGLGVACDLAGTYLAAETKRLACLRHTLWQLLNAAIPGLVRHTPEVSLPNTLTVSFPDVIGREVLARAPGLAASTGSACHSGQDTLDTPSATLLAMGVTPTTALGAVRLSLGRATTDTDVSAAAAILVAAHTLAGTAVGVVGRAVGAPFAVLVAEQLFASGADLVVSITSAGQLQPLADPPYFVLIDQALRDEGTSLHYLPPAPWSALPGHLKARIEPAMHDLSEPFITARSWTTDAPYRETNAAIASAIKAGATCVEMEAAALYALAEARGYDIVCLAHITNTMAVTGNDFEKGEANGVHAALALTAHIARTLIAPSGGK